MKKKVNKEFSGPFNVQLGAVMLLNENNVCSIFHSSFKL